MQHLHHHHISPSTATTTTTTTTSSFNFHPAKKRGSYNCGRCGLPKKGHSCHLTTPTTPSEFSAPSSLSSANRPPPAPPRQQQATYSHLRRALSFDDIDIHCDDSPEPETSNELSRSEADLVSVSGGLPAGCLWEVMRRLPPATLLSAARVCKGWRETAKRMWRSAEELKLRVPTGAQFGFVGSVLQKCPGLVRLNLRMERLGFTFDVTKQ